MFNMDLSFEGFDPLKNFNTNALIAELEKQIMEFFQEGYRLFIKGVVDAFGNGTSTSGVDTGMTLGSLMPLASGLGVSKFITERLYKDRKNRIRTTYGGPEGGVKSFTAGLKLGLGAYKLNLGTLDQGLYTLEFNITVFQHDLWEDQWQSLEAGVQAFDDYVAQNINNIFDIDKILSKLI